MPKNSLTESAFVWREEKWVAWTDPADVLRRTRDDAVRIKIGADFEILNEGNASVYIRFIGRYLQAGEEYRFLEGDEPRVFLAPGETTVRRLQGEATLERWSRHWSGPDSEAKPLRVRATVVCSDLYDDGVVDKWVLEIVGRPVEAVPDDLSAWRPRDV